MEKLIGIHVVLILLTGCAASPEQLAEVEACRSEGHTAYTYSWGKLRDCVSPKDQARLEKLELACVSSGGTVDYNVVGMYENCKRRSAAKVKVKNSSSGFKPYCPPSKYPIYGCGNTSTPSTSTNRNPPPGNKTCTYKSGPYQWTKTISGFTCPPTDSSNGNFGTLVR